MSRVFVSMLVVAGVGLSGCNKEDPWMRMYRQKKNRPYSKSAVFTDGRAMREPVEGTVSRERRLDLDQGMPPMSLAFLNQGKKKYDVVCATCHGFTGESDWSPLGVKSVGSMVTTNFALNPAPSWHQERLRAKDDFYYYNAISKGFGYMPAFTEIPQEDRWAIVAYIRALQLSQRYPYDRLSDSEKAEVVRPERGREVDVKKEHL